MTTNLIERKFNKPYANKLSDPERDCLLKMHFVSKDALNIDGFGKKIVENFWNLKLIKFPQDIFKLDYNIIRCLEGWGNLSVIKLEYAINAKKKISLEKFIYSLGIRHIGQENAKLIARHLKSSTNFLSAKDVLP